MKTKRLLLAVCLLLISATMLGTASFAWFSMNTEVAVEGIQVEAYSDSLFLEISDTGDDDDFDTSVDLSSNGEKVLRLAKHGFVDKLYNISVAAGSGNYTGTGTYYKLVAETADSNKKYVLAVVDEDLKLGTALSGLYKDLVFNACAADATSDGTTTYYEIEGGKYVVATKASGESVKGCYTLTPKDAETTGNYAGSGTGKFYSKGTDGSYADVTSTLETGTNLANFFTITNPTEVDYDAAEGEVYLKNKLVDEYSFYAKYDTATDINDVVSELYFGRAYSDVIANGDLDDTLSIIKNEVTILDSYRYTDTVYIRNAKNTNNSKDLKVDFTVGGVANELSNALRVLLVVSLAGEVINTVEYNNGTDAITYANGDNIIEVLLGNKQETLTVDIYVYFDGTDAAASNQTVPAGILNGQTVELNFTIDGVDYNVNP